MLQLCRRWPSTFFSEAHEYTALHISRRYPTTSTKPRVTSTKPRVNHKFRETRSRSSPAPRHGSSIRLDKKEWAPPSRPRLNSEDQSRILAHFSNAVPSWCNDGKVRKRLVQFGVPKRHVRPLLREFGKSVQAGEFSDPELYRRYALVRFAYNSPSESLQEYDDTVITSILYAWATDTGNPARRAHLISKGVLPDTLDTMTQLVKATSIPFPADTNRFTHARRASRKIIMHVGPTNSGKTHNALRALAAANRGIYAGPLRLLAHEIWDRFNSGKIIPLGVEGTQAVTANSKLDDALPTSPLSTSSSLAPPLNQSLQGNPDYVRPCNMITGEEVKLVSADAPLVSCTVEMLSPSGQNDVAVIDEIQMIADEIRGFAWTEAVLGTAAPEVHLCGEETAVPLVQELLKGTNDELIVNRYERLNPLIVEERSLHNDLANVKPGDCIVAFSRKRIFLLKKLVEQKTGLKCAVVYGNLPPEIRNMQADLFNTPGSGYDVIIGSDAIGMGLNLKIRRVIFDDVRKFDGTNERILTVSQAKQIAGRAGRYGMGSDNGGFVTTRDEKHLPLLKELLAQPNLPLTSARWSPSSESLETLRKVLPEASKDDTHLKWNVHRFVGILGGGTGTEPGRYRYVDHGNAEEGLPITKLFDGICRQKAEPLPHTAQSDWTDSKMGFSGSEIMTLLRAPLPWRQKDSRDVIFTLLSNFLNDYHVPLMDLLTTADGESLMDFLANIERRMKHQESPGPRIRGWRGSVDQPTLVKLEEFHRILGVYSWLALRMPVAFTDADTVLALKPRVEKVLQWALQSIDLTKGDAEPAVKRNFKWENSERLERVLAKHGNLRNY